MSPDEYLAIYLFLFYLFWVLLVYTLARVAQWLWRTGFDISARCCYLFRCSISVIIYPCLSLFTCLVKRLSSDKTTQDINNIERGHGNTRDTATQVLDENTEVLLQQNRELYLPKNMTREKKREFYSNPVILEDIPPWDKDSHNSDRAVGQAKYEVDAEINKKISIWKGGITRLEIDAIVNAANKKLKGGGGVDGAIHRAAGPDLLKENQGLLKECPTGEARVAAGYRLPAYYVIHTTGPQDGSHEMLERCYKNCLSEVLKNNIRTVAFPGISTGVYKFPIEAAFHIAAETVRKWLQDNYSKVDRIIFCVYEEEAMEVAYRIIPIYFPRHNQQQRNEQL